MLRSLAALLAFSPAAIAVAGCDPGGSGSGAGGGASSCGTGTCEPADAGTVACGTETCGPNQVCNEPCCGGAPPDCQPLPDGGGCPAGYGAVDWCSTDPTSGPACEELPCTPEPPKCFDIPAACPSELTCECLPKDSCVVNGCDIYGHEVSCLGCE
jgi:hypothetical protein